MTLEEFKKLDMVQKYRLVRDNSMFVASRDHGGFRVGLYRIEDFYVEAFFRLGFSVPDYIEIPDQVRVNEYIDQLSNRWWD